MEKYYCGICGNHLDPKIHYKPEVLGKTSKEMIKFQKELLKLVLKTTYVEDRLSGKKMYFTSLIETLGLNDGK